MPHLKRGALKDFRDIMGAQFDDDLYNKTESQYHYKNEHGIESIIEAFGADESAKTRGPRRNILYINEGNNVPWETTRNLDVRTDTFTFVDWNPVSEFWAHEQWKGKPENEFIHSTYLDAKWVLTPQKVKDIEAYRYTDPNWWNVYGLGRPGRVEGLVYPYFEQVAEIPSKPIFNDKGEQVGTKPDGQEFYGLDFGYSNDPSVLVRCVLQGDKLYCDEVFYEAGLTNDAIAHKMDECGVKRNYAEIFADSAEPKSIDEIHKFGFNIKPCPKGADSVEYGHQKVRQLKQFWTSKSLNCIKEQRNFRYIQDKDGHLTDKTNHQYSHGMDARRYAVVAMTSRSKLMYA